MQYGAGPVQYRYTYQAGYAHIPVITSLGPVMAEPALRLINYVITGIESGLP